MMVSRSRGGRPPRSRRLALLAAAALLCLAALAEPRVARADCEPPPPPDGPCCDDWPNRCCYVPPFAWCELIQRMDVTLTARAPDGTALSGQISLAQAITVEVKISNSGASELHDFSFANDYPLIQDSRSTGYMKWLSGATPSVDPNLTLAPGQSITYSFELSPIRKGIVAAHTKVTAEGEDGKLLWDAQSLRFDIADGAELTEELGRWVLLQAMDQYLQKSYRSWHEATAKRGEALYERIKAVLSGPERRKWFGSARQLLLSPFDHAMARLRGVAAEMVAASRPKNPFKGFTAEELNDVYAESFKDEVGNGVSEWAKGWADLTDSAKKGLKDSWAEATLAASYYWGSATPDERLQFEAYAMTLVDGSAASADNLYNTVKNEVPRWRENLTYLDEALDMAVADATLQSPDIQAQMAAEEQWRQNMIDLAPADPVLFQREWAKRDAEIFNLGIPLVFDTVIGGGVFRAGGALSGAVVRGKGAAIMRAGKAAGVLDEGGNVAKGAKTAVKPLAADAPRGVALGDVAEIERAGGYLDNVEGATIVQSSDLGNVYELPNLGGVPEVTLDAKAGILGELEAEYLTRTGEQVKLAEVLKPSSPLRKPGGVAKVELIGQKTGKPAMLDAGAPKDVLAEASVWHSPTRPQDLPGFKSMSKARQQAAIKEWKAANTRWEEWSNPAPGSKTARLKECIGQRRRVPLDTEPNAAGIQRFVTAEFEEVTVVQGNAEAKLLRAKHYEVEVVDTKTGRTVNRKTVVDASEAAPMTPDADGVAVGKVVGTDPAGRPIIEPLSRSEREFVMPRYIDKNLKARRKPPGSAGAIPDAAEHGVTLVMDDASAQAAGKLLASYGVPFLPERVGLPFLKRIAPFVSKAGATTEEIAATYEQLVAVVRSEGGFSQHAVVVTSDSRYLGEVPFAEW